jgi:hypothetical protein
MYHFAIVYHPKNNQNVTLVTVRKGSNASLLRQEFANMRRDLDGCNILAIDCDIPIDGLLERIIENTLIK